MATFFLWEQKKRFFVFYAQYLQRTLQKLMVLDVDKEVKRVAFDSYFLMDEANIKDYILEKTNFFDSADLTVTEIGDGNLNYVYRIEDEGGTSVIVKHSGITARISDEFVLSTDRTIREGKVLKVHGKFVPGLTPEVYHVDDVMKCVVMEDLKDYQNLRLALNDGQSYPNLGTDIGTYLAETLINTSDFVLSAKEKKALQQELINPELCEISEDLVFTEPLYDNNNRNELSNELLSIANALIYQDLALKEAAAVAKLKFLNKAEALIHGDLHTGSIFVTETSTKIIDPEFGFYGPAGYDVGNVIAHLIFAYANAEAKGRTKQTEDIANTLNDVLSIFKTRALQILKERTTDIALNQETVFLAYLKDVERDALIIAGLEIIRRIVGLAKVHDITELESELRVQKEVQLLKFAKFLVKHPNESLFYPSLLSIYRDYEVAA